MRTVAIHLPDNSKSAGLKRMLTAFGEIFGIRIQESKFPCNAQVDAWILPEADKELVRHSANCNIPIYASICASELVSCGKSTTIEFSKKLILLGVLSGRQIRTDEAISVKALPIWLRNTSTLCSKDGSPIWSMCKIESHQHHHFVSLPIPGLNEDEPLFHYLNEKQFLHLLPLFLFLRSLTEEQHWTPPPLQASFMFDDPNLHWPTYGFINFAEIAQEAVDHNYHVSFATIPLDTWFIHNQTVSLFKKYRKQLSLLIHGNDHVHKELGGSNSDRPINSILAESLLRIARFEHRSGLTVSRIMVPPHGACSEVSLGEMARLGFEAACVSKGSLGHYNSHAKWLLTLGMRPAENVCGLTVLPRFRISSHCYNSIILAALLHQAIIPVGHHHDLAEGLKILGELSDFINSLGDVQWGSLNEISRSRYSQMVSGRTLNIRMFSKRIQVRIPEGINEIYVERLWLADPACEDLSWHLSGGDPLWKPLNPEETIAVAADQVVEIISGATERPVTCLTKSSHLHIWPFLRRQLTELRDRAYPPLRRISTMFFYH